MTGGTAFLTLIFLTHFLPQKFLTQNCTEKIVLKIQKMFGNFSLKKSKKPVRKSVLKNTKSLVIKN